MTPAHAIKAECRRCNGGSRRKCESKVCALNKPGYKLLRIKAHCRECNGDDHPSECTGRLLNGEICFLHPFRLGRNPSSKMRTLTPERKAAAVARLEKYRYRPKLKGPFSVPGSTIMREGRSSPIPVSGSRLEG